MTTDPVNPPPGEPSIVPRVLVWGAIALLVIGAYLLGRYRREHRYDALAQCMAGRQMKMYGAYWCPHCADQKEILGSSSRFVYEECGVPGSHEEQKKCADLGVKLFPTWRLPDGTLKPGVLSAQDLSKASGCSLP